jgi:putative salt-induced outer membrane protein
LQLRPGVSLTQSATAFLDSEGNSFTSATGLEAQLVGRLSARVSYNVQYESQPGDGLKTTDTQSRFSLIYGF